MQSPGALLRRHREARGLSQVQVEELTGITQGHISAIELGRRAASVSVLRRLVEVYELDALAAGEVLMACSGDVDAVVEA